MAIVPVNNNDKQLISSQDLYDDYIDLTGYGKQLAKDYYDPAAPYAKAQTQTYEFVSDLLKQGATIIGKWILDSAGRKIAQVTDNFKMPKLGRKNAYAPVQKAPIRKNGPARTAAQPVFTQPRSVEAPVSISRRVMMKSKPNVTAGSKGVLITHREMIGQIISSASTLGYSVDSFTLNPGKYATFPWLSNIAGNFDRYIMRKLRFYTISNQSTSVAGRVGLGFDVDSTDVAPADRNEFFALTYHAECAPWDTVVLDIPCDAKERFVNSHTTSDSKLIDMGQIHFMSDAITAVSTALSDVVVEYAVELIDAQQAIYSSQFINIGQNRTVASLDQSPSFGPVVAQLGNTAPFLSTTTVLYLEVQQGYYLLSLYENDAGAGTPAAVIAVTGGTGTAAASNSTTEKLLLSAFKITSNRAAIRITFSGVTVPNLEFGNVVITRIPAAVYVNALAAGAYVGAVTVF